MKSSIHPREHELIRWLNLNVRLAAELALALCRQRKRGEEENNSEAQPTHVAADARRAVVRRRGVRRRISRGQWSNRPPPYQPSSDYGSASVGGYDFQTRSWRRPA